MDSIRYGIVGCAGIGTTHAGSVGRATGADLVACADVDADAARDFAAEYDLDAYDDVTTMIEDGNVDAVSVCTPSGTHADVVVEAANAGADILCEKPLDVYADRMTRMIDACDEAGVTLAGVFQRRFEPAARRAKSAVESGELGDLVVGDTALKWFRSQEYYDSGGWRGTRAMDGGAMLNQAIHSIDRLQWLVGDVESVQAATTRHRDIECETSVGVALSFRNGAVGTVSATTTTKGGRDRTELNGTDGSLGLAGGDLDYFETGDGEEGHYGAETGSREVDLPSIDGENCHDLVVQDFVDALRAGEAPAVPGREARKAVDLILAAEASSARGEAVRVADVRAGRVPEANADDA